MNVRSAPGQADRAGGAGGAALPAGPTVDDNQPVTPSDSPLPPGAEDPRGRDQDVRLDALVDAVRSYRNAEGSMRGRSRGSMHLGRTDMTALRLMLRAGQSGRPLTAAALARGLGISTAATTVLVDRLEKSGHAERRRSRTDGRSIEIWPSAAADEEVRSTMGPMHDRMIAVAGSLSQAECRVVRRFLEILAAELSELDVPSRTDPRVS